MTTLTPFKIALIQEPPVFLNREASVVKALNLIETAAGSGARIIIFPETWLPGYPVWLDFSPAAGLWDHPPAIALYRVLSENALEISGPALEQLQQAAGNNDAWVVMGAHEKDGGTLYNTIVYLSPDGSVRIHRKLMPTYTERLIWGRGDGSTLTVLETAYGRLGGLICWEHWMPLARAAMHAKRETLHIAQWPMVKELHQIASRHYAFEGQCYVTAAGCVLSKKDVLEGFCSQYRTDHPAYELLAGMPGDDNELLLKGGSTIIGPDAGYVTAPLYKKAATIYGEIDPGRIAEGHLTLDTDGHYARPDVFELRVNDAPQRAVRFRSQE